MLASQTRQLERFVHPAAREGDQDACAHTQSSRSFPSLILSYIFFLIIFFFLAHGVPYFLDLVRYFFDFETFQNNRGQSNKLTPMPGPDDIRT